MSNRRNIKSFWWRQSDPNSTESANKTKEIKCPDCKASVSRHELLTPPGCWQCYTNRYQLYPKKRRMVYKNINNLSNHHNISEWWSKNIKTWTTTDVIAWIYSLNLPQKWHQISLKTIKKNECNGHKIMKCKSAKQMDKMLGITNPMLCNRLFKEIRKFYIITNKPITSNKTNPAFKLHIFSQNKHIELDLKQKCSKSVKIGTAIKLFKKQSNVAANIDDIHFYSKGNILDKSKTLEQVDVIDDMHLITVKFDANAGQ